MAPIIHIRYQPAIRISEWDTGRLGQVQAETCGRGPDPPAVSRLAPNLHLLAPPSRGRHPDCLAGVGSPRYTCAKTMQTKGRHRWFLTAAAAILLAVPASVQAQIYSWRDANG